MSGRDPAHTCCGGGNPPADLGGGCCGAAGRPPAGRPPAARKSGAGARCGEGGPGSLPSLKPHRSTCRRQRRGESPPGPPQPPCAPPQGHAGLCPAAPRDARNFQRGGTTRYRGGARGGAAGGSSSGGDNPPPGCHLGESLCPPQPLQRGAGRTLPGVAAPLPTPPPVRCPPRPASAGPRRTMGAAAPRARARGRPRALRGTMRPGRGAARGRAERCGAAAPPPHHRPACPGAATPASPSGLGLFPARPAAA